MIFQLFQQLGTQPSPVNLPRATGLHGTSHGADAQVRRLASFSRSGGHCKRPTCWCGCRWARWVPLATSAPPVDPPVSPCLVTLIACDARSQVGLAWFLFLLTRMRKGY
jgi:hypothetical protein